MNKKLSNGKDAATIYIVSRSANSSDSDCVMTFGNKLATANIYFDLKDIFLYSSKDSSLIFEDKNQYRIFGHLTDNIQPIRFRVSQNADGDFANTDQTYFTGGFHGYQNLTDEKASPTLFEKEKYVTVDNHPLAMNQKMAGNHIHIAVTNLIQASNTEKKEGLGRYALKQSITIDYLNDTAFVQIDYTPLEDIFVYQVDGLGFYNDLENIQFIGSKTKTGIYKNNFVNRADCEVLAIRQFNNREEFNVFVDKHYGIGNLTYNKESYNAQTTESQKSYFHLLAAPDNDPVFFKKGQTFSVRGGYVFKRY